MVDTEVYIYYPLHFQSRLTGIEAQGRPPRNVLQWYVNYFTLKPLGKQLMQGHLDPLLPPSKQEINPPYEKYPSCTRKHKTSLLPEVGTLKPRKL